MSLDFKIISEIYVKIKYTLLTYFHIYAIIIIRKGSHNSDSYERGFIYGSYRICKS